MQIDVKDKLRSALDVRQGSSATFERAVERARKLGRPVLASTTIRLTGELAPIALGPQRQYFAWEQPERDLHFIALGQAVALTAEGEDRFRSVLGQIERVLSEAVIDAPGEVSGVPLPLCFAGFAFEADAGPGVEWQSFPDALALIPRLLFSRRGDAHQVSMNVWVKPADDPGALVSELVQAFAEALRSKPKPSVRCNPGPVEFVGRDGWPAWQAGILSLTESIARGEAEKVVHARRLEVEAEDAFDVDSVLCRLRQRYPSCTVFAVRNNDACFLGATPEMLVRLEHGRVRADCLAGSAARGGTEVADRALGEALLADDKERREHAMVVRGFVESLSEVCGDFDVPGMPSLRKMANVQHLHTPIAARAEGKRHVLDLVERLHPTPATGGLPRDKALSLIREHEGFDRGWYAGPIGWIDAQGGGEFAVALRSALVRDRRALLYAGCGIVRGSDPEREYEESRLKLEAMLWALRGTP